MRHKKVVYVEDNHDDQLLASRIFSKMDYSPDVIMLDDGEEAITYLKRLVDVPDLVFVDLSLPKLNGVEVIREMKKLERYLTVPFVVMTDSNSQKHLLDAYKAGAFSFINKLQVMDWGRELKGATYYWLSINQRKVS